MNEDWTKEEIENWNERTKIYPECVRLLSKEEAEEVLKTARIPYIPESVMEQIRSGYCK